ncbi:MAG: UDP-N-acetylglucosamine--N-acetylmuramyl-(pentapeptide) pyrophosphoryl-undecaprenol N-acetylglucosamine transferase [Phycisphaera sp.]|nr:UDP-N-acetylglucosamine--N-acetylmuramyl-(pentapeptide) pyrophosphoryl-undecaprenol N-acetylglucosamine transferase [Phycisphaera sp.]
MLLRKQPRILAVASGGGHWVQLLRLRPAFDEARVTYVTVRRSYESDVPGEDLRVVPDATRWNKFKLLLMAVQLLWIVATIRPDVVISTGAAPGYFAIRFGRWFGARTCWLDSIANAEELSLSGRKIRNHATTVLSQWADVAATEGVDHAGSVL